MSNKTNYAEYSDYNDHHYNTQQKSIIIRYPIVFKQSFDILITPHSFSKKPFIAKTKPTNLLFSYSCLIQPSSKK